MFRRTSDRSPLISTTAYFHRDEISGYDGTLYNLGYYQTLISPAVDPAPVERASSRCSTDRACTCRRD